MSDNRALLFTSLWFSLFLMMLFLANSLFCFECIGAFNAFLATLLCILCSYELSITIALKLAKEDKNHKK